MGEPAPTTSPLLRRYTLEEFFALEPPPGGGYYELIGGVLYMVPPPDWSHGLATSNLDTSSWPTSWRTRGRVG
jgi:Uma2 family endonuclease